MGDATSLKAIGWLMKSSAPGKKHLSSFCWTVNSKRHPPKEIEVLQVALGLFHELGDKSVTGDTTHISYGTGKISGRDCLECFSIRTVSFHLNTLCKLPKEKSNQKFFLVAEH